MRVFALPFTNCWALSVGFTLTLVSGVFFTATAQESLLTGHPRESYENVEDIEAMESALRKSLAELERYSYSRSWWKWDRLRARYVDGGRKDTQALRILRAVFRGLILDWHRRFEERGEGDLMYLFFTTLTGDRKESVLDVGGREVYRDRHGGGYHGGWGGAARMRIYEELATQHMLTAEEKERFRGMVHQSLEKRFIDFERKAQTANNHSFGNGGGVAMALKLFPDAPQAAEARAWLDRIWQHLADEGDWREWTYYPYGPIFLHGVLDIAEATGRLDSDRELIRALGRRCLGFVHGNGVRGNPNAGSRVRDDQSKVYADPWNVGYYEVETSSRDGHFWYRLAQHFRDSDFLWAAEQVALGGRPASGAVPEVYADAYKRRFAWFLDRGIEPSRPEDRASVGLLSGEVRRIPERLYLHAGREPEKPFAAYFLYEKKDAHLDNVSGHLYEYTVNGAKYLHTSGKYNNVYSGDTLVGGGTGEESLDLLLVLHRRHAFPQHPDRLGDERDFMRRGAIVHDRDYARAETNAAGDAYGQFAFDHYYGPESRWVRRSVLTAEGYLVVADDYLGAEILGENYRGGPVWHLALDEDSPDQRNEEASVSRNWFEAPAFDQAWWRQGQPRVLLLFHEAPGDEFGSIEQSSSQDIRQRSRTTYAHRGLVGGKHERFLSVFLPHDSKETVATMAEEVLTEVSQDGTSSVEFGGVHVTIRQGGLWSVSRVP